METKKLTDQKLLELIQEKSKQEKRLTLEVIRLIREVEIRRLFLGLGYGSLFEYVTRGLGYEEAAALRRIAAARLLRELPDLEGKVVEGTLSLSNLAQAQGFFRREEKRKNKRVSVTEKREVLLQLENQSSRQAKVTLLKLSPEQVQLQESQKPVTETQFELKVILDERVMGKLDRLKLLLSHRKPQMTTAELISELAEMALKKLDSAQTASLPSTEKVQKDPDLSPPRPKKVFPPSRFIPISIRRAIWKRDQGQCAFIHPQTQRRCESRYQLELHHRTPFARGGPATLENLTLVCKRHNAFFAVKDYGRSHMKHFMPSLRL